MSSNSQVVVLSGGPLEAVFQPTTCLGRLPRVLAIPRVLWLLQTKKLDRLPIRATSVSQHTTPLDWFCVQQLPCTTGSGSRLCSWSIFMKTTAARGFTYFKAGAGFLFLCVQGFRRTEVLIFV